MRYFLDTEFIEDGKTIDLVSIGIVSGDGREFYAENLDADLSKASPWVQENVLPHLWSRQPDKSAGNAWSRDGGFGGLLSRESIAKELILFFAAAPNRELRKLVSKFNVDSNIEIWTYYGDYDWVVFCQLFGTMMDLPEGFPMYARDIKQECDRLGNPRLPEQGKGEHNALADARWNKKAYEFLKTFEADNDGNT